MKKLRKLITKKNLIKISEVAKSFLIIILFVAFDKLNAQNIACGTPLYYTIPQTNALNCSQNSPAFLYKYGTQLFHVPTSLPNFTPLVTLKVAFHIFNKNDGSGSYPASYDVNLNGQFVKGAIEFYSQYSSSYMGNDQLSPFYIYDSRVRYEVVGVYHYSNTVLNGYNGQSLSHFTAWDGLINSIDPTRLENAIPIYFTDGYIPSVSGHAIFPNGVGFANPGHPFVVTFLNPSMADYWANIHLRHELGHVVGFTHTYDDPTDMNCSSLDFLSDVYPTPNLYWAQTGCGNPPNLQPCGTAVETQAGATGAYPYLSCNTCNGTNNVMSACVDNVWMSPLQMGRRRRTLSLSTVTNVRKYVKDVESDHINVWNIANNETWDFDIQMYNDIVVKYGKTLTVKCKIAMATNGKIIVEKGAKLVIDGGELTGWCKTGAWKGVEIDGTVTQSQAYSPGGYASYQGMVVLMNNATISKAQDGITTGIYDASGNFVWGSQGGIILGYNSNFINNVHDVEFLAYPFPNKSTFTSCNFKTTGALVGNVLPVNRVSLWEVQGVKFYACNFEFSAQSVYPMGSRGDGIYSIDASYQVDHLCNSNISPCTSYISGQFKEFDNGVWVDNTNPLRVVSIKNTNFYDNVTNSVYYNSINTPVFEKNYCRTPGLTASSGLYLNNCKYYNVKNSTFLQNTGSSFSSDVGIFANNSQIGAHRLYRNNFANFYVGIDAIGDNSGLSNLTDGLKMNCNDFSVLNNVYDIAMTGYEPTVNWIQGATSSPDNLVRNIYSANCGYQNKWYIDQSGIKIVGHGSNSDANTQPLPQPSCSNPLVNVGISPFSLNYPLHCPELSSNTNNPNYLSNLNSSISNAVVSNKGLLTKYNSLVDGGNTQNLLNAVNSGMSEGGLKSLLLQYSPYLSDAVLSAYFNRADFPLGIGVQIHNANKPVTKEVWQIILSRNLPSGIMSQLTQQQNAVSISERQKLESQISISDFDLQALCAEKLNYFLVDSLESSRDTVIKILTDNIGKMKDADVQLVFAYVNKGDYGSASDKANQLTDITGWGTLPAKLVSYYQRPEGIMFLKDNLQDVNYFRDMANRRDKTGTGSAQSILKFVFDQDYFIPRYLPNSGGTGARTSEAISEISALNEMFNLYPNPANDVVNLVYNGGLQNDLVIKLTDGLGRILFNKNINSPSKIEIPVNEVSSGVYFLTVYSSKELIFNKKVVINK